jgi:hypothetical protein
MADILNPTFSIKTAAGPNEFIFRVPTPLDKARQGARETAIRRIVDPTSVGWADGLDADTFYIIRGMTVLELFLEKTDAKWVYTETPKDKAGAGGVYIDITRFPPGTEDVIMEVGRSFQAGLDKFHGRGAGSEQPPVPEVVASGVDTEALRPVAPEAPAEDRSAA